MTELSAPPEADAGAPSGDGQPERRRYAATSTSSRRFGLRRRNRVSKWDRGVDRGDWRWWVGGFGKVLISVGVLMFAFVAYQLWGTAIETARAQNALENDFEELVAAIPPVTTAPVDSASPPTDTAPSETDPDLPSTGVDGPAVGAPLTAEEQNLPPNVQNGDALARLQIPTIGVDDIIVAGVTKADLKKGPGHYPGTPLPGQLGNSAIAGHRTTFGQPFFDIDKLQPGDDMIVTTLTSTYVYTVTGQRIVAASDSYVIGTDDPSIATLTLTSCHPKYTARERIIVTGVLDPARSGPVGEAVLNYGQAPEQPTVDAAAVSEPTAAEAPADPVVVADTTPVSSPVSEPAPGEADPNTVVTDDVTDDTASGVVADETADAFASGWFSDPGANSQILLWGFVLAAIGIVAWLISRRFRHDSVGLLVGIVPFVIVLYFFFQNVNRLLPPNL